MGCWLSVLGSGKRCSVSIGVSESNEHFLLIFHSHIHPISDLWTRMLMLCWCCTYFFGGVREPPRIVSKELTCSCSWLLYCASLNGEEEAEIRDTMWLSLASCQVEILAEREKHYVASLCVTGDDNVSYFYFARLNVQQLRVLFCFIFLDADRQSRL